MYNVFVGQDALAQFLDPKNFITPLVELDSDLNPFFDRKIRIFIKLMSHTTLFNIKQVTVSSMLQNNHSQTENIVESSSGNTALTLSVLAKYYGYKKTKFYFSHRVPLSKLNLIKLLADEIEINKEPLCPDKKDPNSSINKAKNLVKTKQYLNLDQYSNQNNPEGHYEVTGDQIVKQIKTFTNDLDYFFAALGTTGTIVGTSRKLKEHFSNLKSIGVVTAEDVSRLGARSLNLLEEVGFEWRKYVDELVEIDTQTAFKYSHKLIKKGLFVGPSTGHIFAGVIKFLNSNQFVSKNIVFTACDTFLPYVDEYLKYLPNEDLAQVINEQFAIQYSETLRKLNNYKFDHFKIKAEDFIVAYNNSKSQKDVLFVDLRSEKEFKSFRLKNVIKMNIHDIEEDVLQITGDFKDKKIYFVDCGFSDTAKLAASILRSKSFEAYWVDGGMDYISKNFPFLIIS